MEQFAENSFDFVILSQTLQAMPNAHVVMREMLRVGREGIVTYPNFGYWRHRLDVMLGHMPVSKTLPHRWYDTPNIHLCTVKDFEDLCLALDAVILDEGVLHAGRQINRQPNRFGCLGVYLLREKQSSPRALLLQRRPGVQSRSRHPQAQRHHRNPDRRRKREERGI